MASDSSNASSISFGGTVSKVRSIGWTVNGNEIDVTNLADTAHEYLGGIPDYEVTVEVVGLHNVAIHATGALTISWNDGSQDSISSSILTQITQNANLDTELTTSLTFKPYGG